MRVKLNRAQIGRARGLDVTVKSAKGWAKAFAPTWPMVLDHKAGKLTNAEYTEQYIRILDSIPKGGAVRALWNEGQKTGQVTLLCFCKDGAFCHTYLLIDYLTSKYPDYFGVV